MDKYARRESRVLSLTANHKFNREVGQASFESG